MPENDPQKNLPPTPPQQSPGSSPNWGLMILTTIIAGILLVAFVFDGALAPPAKAMKLDEFQNDYRSGLIVQHDQKNFPIEVVTSDGSSEGVITAYRYRKAPQFKRTTFFMPFTDSDALRTLCNRYGIVNSPRTRTGPLAGAPRVDHRAAGPPGRGRPHPHRSAAPGHRGHGLGAARDCG